MALADRQTNSIPRIELSDLLGGRQPTIEEVVARATNVVVKAHQDGHITTEEATVLLKWIEAQRQELAARQVIEQIAKPVLSRWPFTPHKRRIDDHCDCCDNHADMYR